MLSRLSVAALFAAFAAAQADRPRDLTEMSIEELMSIELTSVSKKSQPLNKTAASAFVITSEDIRRSGMNSLPEVLRLAPGVQVARAESGIWAISIRGFNDDFSNKLLVLIDGRTVYNELYGGVFWQLQQMPLEDIDRIEVIRGPVAAMWGANAVNGVVNIITKSAADTQGGFVQAEAGSESETTTSARFGGRIGAHATYRASGRYTNHDPLSTGGRPASPDGWSDTSADFRIDWNRGRDTVSFTGQAYRGSVPHPVFDPSPSNPFPAIVNAVEQSSTGSLLGRWQHPISESSSFELRASFAETHSGDANVPAKFHIADVDFQHRFALGDRNDILWGVSLRQADYHVTPQPTFSVTPSRSSRDRATFFAEDEIAVVPDKLTFIAAAQVSWDQVSHLQLQPTARLLWTPTSKLMTWTAVSEAVRTADLIERGFDAILGSAPVGPHLAGLIELKGNPSVKSEPMISYEAGQRYMATKHISLDLSAFYNDYHSVDCNISLAPFITGDPAYLEIPLSFSNQCRAQSYGAELSATWNAASHWRLIGGYSLLHVHAHPPEGQSANIAQLQGSSPIHQFSVRSELDLTRRLQFDTAIYYYGAMPQIGIPQYTRGDARLGWSISRTVELSAGIQDALRPYHAEFLSTRVQEALEVHRNIYGKLTWRY